MDTYTSKLLALGLVAIVAGVFVLINLVSEIGSSIQRKWIIFVGLGMGVMAFTFKIVMILTFSTYQQSILGMLPARDFSVNNTGAQNLNFVMEGSHFLNSGYQWKALPISVSAPKNNRMTEQKIALGRKLFHDTRLSIDNSISCATCHVLDKDKGGGDGQVVSTGVHGQKGKRNAPTVLNAAFQRVLFWDGRAATLEQQARGPILNPVEMGIPSVEMLVERLRRSVEYNRLFKQAFGRNQPINFENITRAIASYERTLITPGSPYDRFVKGDKEALTQAQVRGMALFETTGCVQCHSGPNFSGPVCLMIIQLLEFFRRLKISKLKKI